ncbi:heavy metal translocating P-type ATPase [Roseibacterium sp. SDUM158016]|jgi:Cu2+-exporting ATPase|uniref:heavy metal translocating P-type ATPase n=1 Tax=Roseicyclus sediminis TaxID=2980997 RepID=UPI0021D2F6D3|nr:heavy metal translocating P-type ATPase [Roseibacterium sp. SDUM158016]MCU4654153.1 heavy metal translocating P-type ATPase [Roseibacterium sp. SDUM158016]
MTATFEHGALEHAERARPGVCAACNVAPAAEHLAELPKDATLMLSLPGIHCAGCISGVEKALSAVPGVRSARVNLTLRRAAVEAGPEVTAETLTQVLDRAGYEAHELDPGTLATTAMDRQGRDLLMRLAVAFFAMMNVMLLSVAVWSGAEGVTRDMMHWISAAIAIPAVIFAGQPFYVSALGALRGRRLNMDVPISLAILLAVGTSLYETIMSGHHAYFDAAIMLCFFLLGGRYLDHRTRASARSAAQELAALEVPRALRITASGEETVAAADLAVGDIVRVKPGGRIPVDGIVTEGTSELDRSLMTGESLPVYAGPGTAVSAGEVNLTGPLMIEVKAAGRDTSLHRIADLVAVAESGRANYNSLADQAAKLYAPGVHILSVAAAVGWWLYTQDLRIALNIAAAVLIITCPCALGLAVPAVTTAASGRLFRKGLLIKDGTALERLSEADTVVFDKTGTLTTGAPEPVALDDLPEEALRVALALAESSSHPLAEALAKGLRARGLRPARVIDASEVPGYGVEGIWRGETVRLGRAAWLGAEAPDVTATFLKIGEGAPLTFRFTDTLREGAAETVAALKAGGKRVILISGDTRGAVESFASRIGIDEVIAEALPAEKAALVGDLSAGGAKVLMVGDGLNDTAALAAAHVSISPASALDAARTASDMVLMGRSLAPIADAITTSGSAARRIRENFTIATVYNVLAVPLAIAGLATPLIAALAMSMSSITVSLNALRLK